MEHPDLAQAAAVVGAAGAVLVLVARSRVALLAGLALLAVAEVGFGLSIVGTGDIERLVSPASVAAAVAGALVLAGGVAALVRWSEAVIPVVLAASPFRLPLDFDTGNRFLLAVAEPGELGRLLPLYVVLAAAVLALAVRAVRTGDVVALPRGVAIPAAAFVALASLSLLWALDVETGTSRLAFFLLPFAALVAVVGRATFAPWLPRVLAAITVALATLFAVVGLYQAATKELLFFAPNLEVANTYAPIFRVTSLFRDPSLYGRHVVLGIVVVVVVLWFRQLQPLVAGGLIAVLWAGLYFSYSQSSMTALFAAVLFVAAVAGGRRIRVTIGGAALVVVLVASAFLIDAAADTSLRRATSDRSRRVDLTARVLADHPVAGVGIGGASRAGQALSENFGPEASFDSHTTPLTIGAELGLLGLVAYAALLAGAAVAIAAVRRRHPPLGLALGAALVVVFVHALFYSGFFEDPITWLTLGLASAFLVAPETAKEMAPRTVRPRELVPTA